ncbi:hypothetical protein BHE74_00059491 [Ensete ventricosum]|nr:hypothetical protein BHE74_00059491 [Ensete ventricosum]
MKQHDPTLTSARIHVLDLCPRKALCLCSMLHLLCQLPSCDLDISPSSTQVVSLLSICIKLMLALMPTIPWISHSLSLILISTLSLISYDVVIIAPSLDLAMHPPIHYFLRNHVTTPRCSLGPLSFVEILS